MRKWCALAFACLITLLAGSGCVTDAAKKQWAEAWKDARGDNMEMGSHDNPKP